MLTRQLKGGVHHDPGEVAQFRQFRMDGQFVQTATSDLDNLITAIAVGRGNQAFQILKVILQRRFVLLPRCLNNFANGDIVPTLLGEQPLSCTHQRLPRGIPTGCSLIQ